MEMNLTIGMVEDGTTSEKFSRLSGKSQVMLYQKDFHVFIIC